MKTIINNLDTNLSIDTYQMFNGEHVYEMEIDYYKSEEGKDVDISYDHQQIVKDLADESVTCLLYQLSRYEDTANIIKSIKVVQTYSPKFYNYTTDSYDMEIDFNANKLNSYIKDNQGEYESHLDETSQTDSYEAKLEFLLNSIETDHYNMDMWERETEIYINNQTVTEISLADEV